MSFVQVDLFGGFLPLEIGSPRRQVLQRRVTKAAFRFYRSKSIIESYLQLLQLCDTPSFLLPPSSFVIQSILLFLMLVLY